MNSLLKQQRQPAYITAGYIGKCVGGAIGEVLIPIPVVGAYIGQYVGEVVTTLICSNLIDTIRFSKEFEKRNSQVIALYKRAEHEIRASQNTLKCLKGILLQNVNGKIIPNCVAIAVAQFHGDGIVPGGGIISIGNEFGMTENDFKKDLITKDNIFSGSDETIILE